ncbi:hypothetical protein, partial [Photorhabdus laumondii]
TSQKISTKLSIACSPSELFLGLHQNFAPGTGFSSISYPEFGLLRVCIPVIFQVASLLAALTHPGHIVCYAPGDSLPCRRDAS